MAKRTKGKCKYCGKEYTFSYMNKHLPVCEERQKKWAEETGGKKTGYFELAIYPKYNREGIIKRLRSVFEGYMVRMLWAFECV